MTCHWYKLPGGGVVHVRMARKKMPRCSYCADVDAQLECDGCDKPLCRTCSVSPRDGLDFCPKCFDKAWKHWLQIQPSSAGTMTRQARRLAFRRWARLAVDEFMQRVPLGAVASKMQECPRCAPGLGADPASCTGHPFHQLKGDPC